MNIKWRLIIYSRFGISMIPLLRGDLVSEFKVHEFLHEYFGGVTALFVYRGLRYSAGYLLSTRGTGGMRVCYTTLVSDRGVIGVIS